MTLNRTLHLSLLVCLSLANVSLSGEGLAVDEWPGDDSEDHGDVSRLVQRLDELEHEIRQLRQNASGFFEESISPANNELIKPPSLLEELTPSTWAAPSAIPTVPPAASPKPTFPSVTINGFFQADSLWFGQSTGNREAVGDIQDGSGFRRTRLSAKGAVAKNVDYFLQMDFGFIGQGEGVRLNDTLLRNRGNHLSQIIVNSVAQAI